MDAVSLPDFPSDPTPGESYYEAEHDRLYRYFLVKDGAKGGMWGYRNTPDVFELTADVLFDDNPRLAGRFVSPFNGTPGSGVWVLVKGWLTPPRVPRIFIDDKNEGRYERNQIDDIRYQKKEDGIGVDNDNDSDSERADV